MIRTTKINEPEAVENDLKQALAITEALDPPDDLRLAVFTTAANLLTHRVVEQVAPGIPLPGVQLG